MKTLLRIAPLVLVLLSAASSQAATAPAVSVSVSGVGVAQVKASGFVSGTVCNLRDPGLAFLVGPSGIFVEQGTLGDPSGALAAALVSEGAATCVAPGQPATVVPVTMPTVANKALVLPLAPSLGAVPNEGRTNGFTWYGWDDPAYWRVLDEQLKAVWSCSFKPATTPENHCSVTWARGVNGGLKLSFDAERPIATDSTIAIKAGDKELVTIGLNQCKYVAKNSPDARDSPDAGLGALYAGAEEERIEITSSRACLRELQQVDSVSLKLGSTVSMTATPDPEATSSKFFLRIREIPADLAQGLQDFEVRIDQNLVGTFNVKVQPPGITAETDGEHRPTLAIGYDSSSIDEWHSGTSVDGFAIVTPLESDPSYAVYNRTTLHVDPALEHLGERLGTGTIEDQRVCQDLWQKYGFQWFAVDPKTKSPGATPLDATDADEFCVPATFKPTIGTPTPQDPVDACRPRAFDQKVDVCHEALRDGAAIFDTQQDQELDAFRNRRAWRLRSSSWGGDVWFEEDWLRRTESRHDVLAQVGFSVYHLETSRLVATAELRDRYGQVQFRSSFVLAEGARRESLPLPLGNALQVECGKLEGQRERENGSPPPRTLPPPPRFGPRPLPVPTASPESEDTEARRTVAVRDVVRNGGVQAVFDSDLDSGSCALVYSPSEVASRLQRGGASDDDSNVSPSKAAERRAACEASAKSMDSAVDRVKAGDESLCAEAEKKKLAQCSKAKNPGTCKQAAVDESAICRARVVDEFLERKKITGAQHEACSDEIDPLLFLYGPQLLEVVLTRGGEPSLTETIPFDPAKKARFPLPAIKERAGDYQIVAHLKGPGSLNVIYRRGSQQSTTPSGTGSTLSTDMEFRAMLRPRGIGGFLRHWRAFVTFPLRFSGLRFPARPALLSNSGEPTAVQLAGVRAGVLAVVEPWNYDTRQNPSIVPLRFATGFNLYDLGTGKFDPAYLVGGSVTLPVLSVDGSPGARNLGSSLALSAFWEVDLTRSRPFAEGKHFLLTFGIDFASLLSE